ncbi:MAG TPA: amino acid adenylation domain-containing protein, partial [Thermoanaerobaculia bacterium]|nr:amino acid adenylation domain-containing protein [Thermoanaerobaculia bacterium]
VHHLVCDGASLAILEGEIGEMYAAALEGRAARLPELALQPVDLAAAERRQGADRWSSQVRYWRGELAGLEPLALPTDHPRPAWSSRHRGRTRPLAWRPGVADAVASLARSAATTPMVVALAGFAAVLARWSGQEDFGVGVPVEGRWRREAEPLVGLFLNTLVVRVDAAGDPAGRELLGRLAARLAGALTHGEVPFERLVEELAPERDAAGAARSPWFQVLVSSRPASGRRLALPGVELAPSWVDTGTAKFDLTLFVDAEAAPGWGGAIEYDADLLEDATVERLAGWLERAWESWAGRPDLRLSELPLWTAAEEAEILARRSRGFQGRQDAPAVHEEPQGELEERIATLFGEALEYEGIGRHDDFFALGGHSLLGSRVVFELRAALGWEVPFAALFEEPTVAGLAARLEEERTALRASEPIAALPRGGALPLSFAQERLWFLEQFEGPSPLYHIPGAFEGTGRLDVAALQAAVSAVWSRHEALRARFMAEGGLPVQTFAPPGSLPIAEVDLSGVAAAGIDEVVGEIVRRPFDLERGPLLRVVLIRAGAGRFRLVLAVHHLVADGVSLEIVERELGAFYRRALGFDAPAPPPLALQHADVASWQRGRAVEERLAAWIAGLGDDVDAAIEPLELPIDHPRPAVSRHRGESHEIAPWVDGPRLASAVTRLAERHGATAYQVFFAAFGALVGRLARRESLTIGFPVSGRTAESRDLVGLFVDTRVVLVNLTGDPTASGLIAAARAGLHAAETRGDVPFERLVEALAPARDRSFSPLYQVSLVARPSAERRLELPGVTLRPLALSTATAKRDLTLFVDPLAATAASGVVEYDADLFDEMTVQRWMGQLGRLLEDMAARPEAPLSELRLLSQAERHQLIVEWNRPTPGPLEATLLEELVDPWEEATPEALAVADPSGSLTYAELGKRADRLAWRLRDLGVAEESRVAICLDRSVDLVVSELAALRAGGAYAPIDPAYPEQRRADMVEIAEARVVVTLSHLAGDWCGDAAVVALDRMDWDGESRPGRPPYSRDPDRLAYAMFTSGSTGRPKGVGMSHRGALHIVTWHRRRYGWTSSDRGAQVSGPSFDAAVNEIWPALGVGASIHVPPPEVRLSPPALLEWFAREGVTVTWTPTPIAEALLAEPEPPGLVLRFLQTGGDRLHRRAPAGSTYLLNNHYGPVENAVLTTEIDVPAEDPRIGPSSLPTIGRPLDGTRAYVLDRSLSLAPWGAAGELVAGGRGVARGYLGDPAQTAERFVPDPYSGEPGSRMYRTGDLVRFRRDGEIDFLGRIDTQVKIRGQRVELGEIEIALTALAGVREAAVLAREDGPGGAGDKRLVAYVVLEPGVDLADADLVEPLRRRLTDAMVPRAFVRLDRLPATTNGKVDRRALAALAPESAAGAGTAPRTEAEARVAAVWAELLGMERVGVEDDFFSLGGHSLLATRVTYRLRQELGVEVPVALLYEAPTVAGLAARLENALATPAMEPEGPAPRDGALPASFALPLSFAQERLWFLEQLEGPSPLYHIAAVVEGRGRLDVGALRSALSAVWSRHEALRARFTAEDGQPLQTFAEPGPLPLAIVDFSGAPSAPALDEAAADAVRRPFDLERGPLLRAVLFHLAPERFRLALVVHHLVADGVSLAILEREIGLFYRSALGQAAPAPPLPALQHADFALWQR